MIRRGVRIVNKPKAGPVPGSVESFNHAIAMAFCGGWNNEEGELLGSSNESSKLINSDVGRRLESLTPHVACKTVAQLAGDGVILQ